MLKQRDSMTSLLCTRQPGGAMKVFDGTVAEDLSKSHGAFSAKGSSNSRKVSSRRPTDPSRPYSCPTSKMSAVDPQALLGHTLKLQEWLNETQVKSIQERTDKEANEAKKMYNQVLGTEDTFVKDITDFLQYKKLLDFRKKEVLHKQWNKSVYQPIQKEIEKEINGPTYSELSKRKRELHKEYLEHTNKKGHVFLDTIAPEEYYPMSLHPIRPSLLVAETNRLSDPLLSQQRARSAEERVMMRCLTGQTFTDSDLAVMRLPPLPLVPQGRHGTDSNTWLEMPMGHIESPVRKASRRRMQPESNASQFALSDWSRKFPNTLVDDEMQLQRRRKCPSEHLVSKVAILNQHKVDKQVQVVAPPTVAVAAE